MKTLEKIEAWRLKQKDEIKWQRQNSSFVFFGMNVALISEFLLGIRWDFFQVDGILKLPTGADLPLAELTLALTWKFPLSCLELGTQ